MRVVVVGAGIAGLTVANALTHAGVETVVLEARARVGGRLHTIDLAGTPVDLGGSWIHTPIGNPLGEFTERAGIACHSGDPLGRFTAYDAGTRRRLTAAEVDASMDLVFEQFPSSLAQLRERLDPLASMADAIEAFVVDAGLEGDLARRARQALRADVEADASDSAERHSLRWFGNEQQYDGDFFGDLPEGGYRSVVDAMASRVDVRLGVEVVEVEHSPEGVVVQAADGSSYDGTHAVIAVPLGVLKQGSPTFSPALPADRQAAIERLGFGRYEKVVLRFDRPFWRDEGLSHLLVFPREDDEPTMWVFDLDAFGDGPALACHVFHSATHHVIGRSTADVTRWALDLLSQAFGHPCPEPVAVAVTSWATDPHSNGAYTHVPPGASPGDADLLGQPVGERLLFAGEHTQSERLGFADGALSSGLREAARLLGTSDVEVGRLPATPGTSSA